MKQWLTKQSSGCLVTIAGDYGYDRPFNRTTAIAYIVDYLKSYGLNLADLKARYQHDSRVHLVD